MAMGFLMVMDMTILLVEEGRYSGFLAVIMRKMPC